MDIKIGFVTVQIDLFRTLAGKITERSFQVHTDMESAHCNQVLHRFKTGSLGVNRYNHDQAEKEKWTTYNLECLTWVSVLAGVSPAEFEKQIK